MIIDLKKLEIFNLMQLNMSKYIRQKEVKNINLIENSFIRLSLKLKKKNIYWWYHEISRLDFRPWGGINLENLAEKKRNFFIINFIVDVYKILAVIVKKINDKKTVNLEKNIIIKIKEKVYSNNKLDPYFQNIFQNRKIKHINIIIDKSFYSDKNNISVMRISSFCCIVKSFILSLKSFLSLSFFIYYQNQDMKDFWKNLFFFKVSLFKLFLNFLLNEVLKNKINNSHKIIYPYEEKTFERSINNFSKQFKFKNVFAYCVNPQDKLAYFLKEYSNLDVPRSNKYLFCGKRYQNFFRKLNRKNIIKDELSTIGSFKGKKIDLQYEEKNFFLVLISHPKEIINFFNFLLEEKKLLKFRYLIRDYPHSNNSKLIKDLIKKNSLNDSVKVSNNSFKKDCIKTKATIFSATSAGIQAINYSKIGIWSNLSGIGMTPFFDDYKNYFPSSNSVNLYKNLNIISELNKRQYFKLLKKQQFSSNQIYSIINEPNVKKIFLK